MVATMDLQQWIYNNGFTTMDLQ